MGFSSNMKDIIESEMRQIGHTEKITLWQFAQMNSVANEFSVTKEVTKARDLLRVVLCRLYMQKQQLHRLLHA